MNDRRDAMRAVLAVGDGVVVAGGLNGLFVSGTEVSRGRVMVMAERCFASRHGRRFEPAWTDGLPRRESWRRRPTADLVRGLRPLAHSRGAVGRSGCGGFEFVKVIPRPGGPWPRLDVFYGERCGLYRSSGDFVWSSERTGRPYPFPRPWPVFDAFVAATLDHDDTRFLAIHDDAPVLQPTAASIALQMGGEPGPSSGQDEAGSMRSNCMKFQVSSWTILRATISISEARTRISGPRPTPGGPGPLTVVGRLLSRDGATSASTKTPGSYYTACSSCVNVFSRAHFGGEVDWITRTPRRRIFPDRSFFRQEPGSSSAPRPPILRVRHSI